MPAKAAPAALRPRAIATNWCLTNLTLDGALRSRLRSDLRRLLQDERVDVQRVHSTILVAVNALHGHGTG